MKEISLKNFLKMTPENPEYSEKDQHYYISGVNPNYYNDNSLTQEEQNAPLIASNLWTKNPNSPIVEITDMTPDIYGNREIYVIDYASMVMGININSAPFYSGNVGAASNTTSHYNTIKCFAGKILAIVKPTGGIAKMYVATLPLALSPTWTDISANLVGGSMTADDYKRYLETFLQYCMYSDGLSKVNKVDSSNACTVGIDLGSGWTVKGMKNYNDKYLAVAGANGGFIGNTLFLWDGISSRYQYSVKMAGQYIDMIVVDGVLYVAVYIQGTGNVSGTGKTELFYLKGTKLVPLVNPQITQIAVGGNNQVLFDFINRVGIALSAPNNELLIYGDTEIGKSEFIIQSGLAIGASLKFSKSYSGYTFMSSGLSFFDIYFYNVLSTTFNQIKYKSKWIPVERLRGIDIIYDTPPQSGTDKISVTIFGRGQDIISGSSTTVLADITPTTFLNNIRSRLDVLGFTGDRVMIQLTTTNAGSWRPLIREINLIKE